MKNILLITIMVLGITSLSAQEKGKVRVGLDLGYAFATGGGGALVSLEPKYNLTKDVMNKLNILQYLPPMLQKPNDWISNTDGGWLWERKSIILGKGTHHFKPQAYDVLNLLQSVAWTIDNTLGVQNIEANNYTIVMYPNPSNNIVNFSLENSLGKNIIVDIVSMDGKKIKSENISNNENAQIDISVLSQGIYIANFYANDVLISSKRLLKN